LFAGTAVFGLGWLSLVDEFPVTGGLPLWGRILVPLVIGGAIMLLAVIKIGKNLVEPLRAPQGAVVDSLYEYRQRDRGPRIVAIGGGTGMPSLLRGLTEYTSNITAIVTVADDGGSSGRLRKELGLLPPGDFRNNLAALARDETLMTQVLQYRFGTQLDGDRHDNSAEQGLHGHAFGNLLLAALITGLVISIFQAATQINEMTLSFIPKLLAIFITLALAGPWILQIMTDYIQRLYTSIPWIIHG
ncbi:MAG: flagellar type III secretion system protein FliQ, partial [Nitrosomonas sp. PRO5]|nr:flagellar type III secretion system protein FliQ [Nitrosomonas sp. PRO5]